MRWDNISILREKFECLDISFYLAEIEAKIYGFLEKNAHEAFTMPDMFIVMVRKGWFSVNVSEPLNNGNHANHPFYQVVQKKVEAMVNDGKISGMCHQGKFYYAVWRRYINKRNKTQRKI